ncbi:acetylesterase [Paenibacillus sp. 598K]|nr:acetylxylan esterase [Paenibacillus sp. 598K]GBF75752.1 acetylesterase [Paenibacillus sp. 598K]
MIVSFVERRIRELEQFSAPQTSQEDLGEFWDETLRTAAERPLHDRRVAEESLSPHMDVYKVTYEGYDDTPIHGWYLLPRFAMPAAGKGLPCLVMYHGYHGSKGYPEQYAAWLMMGYAVFAIDVRGQSGETGNLLAQRHGKTAGWMTQGLLDPRGCYYQAITVDAIRAVEWAAAQPEVDASRIIVMGGSQGGGLALITGALSDIPSQVVADVPNMCHMDYGIYHSQGSLTEAAAFVSRQPEHLETVLRTLSYFDMINLVGRLTVPTFVSASLKDPICMPETIFAFYNRLEAPKQMQIYPFNGHTTSGDHLRQQLTFIRKHDRLS